MGNEQGKFDGQESGLDNDLGGGGGGGDNNLNNNNDNGHHHHDNNNNVSHDKKPGNKHKKPKNKKDTNTDSPNGVDSNEDDQPLKNLLKDVDSGKLKHPLSDPIDKYYTVSDKILGMGNFSVVKLGMNKETGEKVAIKIIDKGLVKNKPEMLTNEVDILLRVDHPHIIGLRDLFETPDKCMLCMELVTGGELFDKIVEREQFNEREAKEVMKQLFSAVEYLHRIGIVHRDLKPENLLLANEKDDCIKIADFGLSRIYTEEMMSTACGTPGYVAPEILMCEGYTKQIDMWSCGVIMYILLCGYPPFYNENDAILFETIMAGQYEFHSPYWDNISDEAKDLIRHLLVVDPQKRLTAKTAQKHDWFKTKAKSGKLQKNFHVDLKRHNSKRRESMVNVGHGTSTSTVSSSTASTSSSSNNGNNSTSEKESSKKDKNSEKSSSKKK